jgi:hypothetical protein
MNGNLLRIISLKLVDKYENVIEKTRAVEISIQQKQKPEKSIPFDLKIYGGYLLDIVEIPLSEPPGSYTLFIKTFPDDNNKSLVIYSKAINITESAAVVDSRREKTQQIKKLELKKKQLQNDVRKLREQISDKYFIGLLWAYNTGMKRFKNWKKQKQSFKKKRQFH